MKKKKEKRKKKRGLVGSMSNIANLLVFEKMKKLDPSGMGFMTVIGSSSDIRRGRAVTTGGSADAG